MKIRLDVCRVRKIDRVSSRYAEQPANSEPAAPVDAAVAGE
ncbi:hypothetical protein [Agrobacterium larrymoorei]|uniref:Uncharacterized protein n=1 Tax=Agrobacterium larrymoorei TaxID=160699 RepID=A0AAF0H6B3_9HYPH|nr:hypothetical protein [Agrobacterium larrymoorei]WHA41179.1 hypothetical protein CFBP5477_000580 [Agrobacterium larrymoorei]